MINQENWFDPDQPPGMPGHSKEWFARVEQYQRQAAQKQAHEDTIALLILIAVALAVATAALVWAYRYRRIISSAIQGGMVSIIAVGMRLNEKINNKRNDLVGRAKQKIAQ